MIDFYIFEYLTQLCRKHIWHSECLYGWRCQSIRCLWAICPCGPADGWSSAAAPKRINASSRPARRLLHEKHWRYFNQSKMRFWKPHGAKQCRTSVFVSPKQVCQQLHMQNFHLRVHRFCVSFTFSRTVAFGSYWIPRLPSDTTLNLSSSECRGLVLWPLAVKCDKFFRSQREIGFLSTARGHSRGQNGRVSSWHASCLFKLKKKKGWWISERFVFPDFNEWQTSLKSTRTAHQIILINW